jgi:hypothetical protein
MPKEATGKTLLGEGSRRIGRGYGRLSQGRTGAVLGSSATPRVTLSRRVLPSCAWDFLCTFAAQFA